MLYLIHIKDAPHDPEEVITITGQDYRVRFRRKSGEVAKHEQRKRPKTAKMGADELEV